MNQEGLGTTRRTVEIELAVAPTPRLEARNDEGVGRSVRFVGRGRSAEVHCIRQSDRAPWARKVFLGDPLAKLIHIVLTGAPNPYSWNEDAIASAVSRRRILETLVRFWFADRLRLPRLHGAAWNEDARVFHLDMEFVNGRGAALQHHVTNGRASEIRELGAGIMRPLQRHLRASGFDGLLWQAGLGNPVASSNFMLEPAEGESETRRWIWIDLESGVPALFPLNPLTLLTFYLPKSLRHRGALFDDVDVGALRGYLEGNRAALARRLDPETCGALAGEVDRLEFHQRRWKRLGRFASSLEYALRRGHITEDEAEHYRTRPIRWLARLGFKALRRLPGVGARVIAKLWRKLLPHSLTTVTKMALRFLFSQTWRTRWASHVIRNRIRSWERRKQLSPEQAHRLVTHVRSEEATAYLTDFGIHLAIKAPVKTVEWLIIPSLFAAGLISETTLLIALASGGAIGRTAYTLGRLIQATFRGREKPWVALITGLLPVVGNGAYPLQIIYTSTERDHDVARFILIDLFTTIGRKLPIWGGPDTQTEHFFNRIPVFFLSRLTGR